MSYSELTRARYSCRSYEDRAVEPEKLSAILEAGRIAPSACNKHPTRVLVCDTPRLREKAGIAAKHFAKDGSVFGAPLVLVVCEKVDIAWAVSYTHLDVYKRQVLGGRQRVVTQVAMALGASVQPFTKMTPSVSRTVMASIGFEKTCAMK